MDFFASSVLTKARGMHANGTLYFSYDNHAVSTYWLKVMDSGIAIQNNNFNMFVKEVPNIKRMRDPRQKAMAMIFSEIVFRQINTLYDFANKPAEYLLDENGAELGTLHKYSTTPLASSRITMHLIRPKSTRESDDCQKLIGRMPTEKEIEFITEYETKGRMPINFDGRIIAPETKESRTVWELLK